MSSPCRYAVDIIGSCTTGDERAWWDSRRINALEIARGLWEKSMSRRNKRRQCDAATPTLADLQTRLDSVRREVRNLTVMGMDPNQTPDQATLIKQLERSARAETRLRSVALAHAKDKIQCRPDRSFERME